ncbi:HNH endonuclease [Escherichia coli O13/129/135:H4]
MKRYRQDPPPDELRDHVYYDDGHIYRVGTESRLGCLGKNGYYNFTYKGRTYLVHRLIYWLHTGEWPEVCDHISRDKTDNHIENLRPSTDAENSRNNSLSETNSSGYTGVEERDGKYNVFIRLEGKRYGIYGYKNKEAAALARDILCKLFYGDFARYGIAENAALKVGDKVI